MNAKEAYKILTTKINASVVEKCYEYTELFVFVALMESDVAVNDVVFDALYSVDKNTGEVRCFNPISLTHEEYNNGKQVTNFK